MILIDSSCWIEYFAGTKFANIIENIVCTPSQIIVPTIVVAEIFKKIANEKDESTAYMICNQFKKCQIISLDFDLATSAAQYGRLHKLAMADSIIYATAQQFSAKIYTMDAHFAGLENVYYTAKI